MRMNVAIGLVNGVENQFVSDQAFVYENVDATVIGALDFGSRSKTSDGERGLFLFGFEGRLGNCRAKGRRENGNFNEFIERLSAEKLIDAIGEFFRGRAVNDGLRGRSEDELLVRIGQRVVCNQRSDVAEFGCVGLQKLAASRNGEKQIGHTNGRTCGKTSWFDADEFAVGEFDPRTFHLGGIARFEQETRYRRDGGKGLATKTERCDGSQVIRGFELAGCVTLEGQQRVVVRHPVAIVNHTDHALAARFGFDANGFCASVERVFEQLLYHRSGALDDFASSNFVGDGFGQYADAAHDFSGCSIATGPWRSLFNAMQSWSSWPWSTSDGESAIRSWALVVLAKAMTSRMDVSPASSMTTRSMPKAMPPCGGVPYVSASRKKPKRLRSCSSERPSALKSRS